MLQHLNRAERWLQEVSFLSEHVMVVSDILQAMLLSLQPSRTILVKSPPLFKMHLITGSLPSFLMRLVDIQWPE